MELASRTDKRQLRYLKESNLPSGKHVGGFDFNAIEGISKARLHELADNHEWVNQATNLLLFGASGVGKTHLASALGYNQIEAGTRVKFYPATALVQHLQDAKQQLKLQDALNKLDKYQVLIMDDIGYIRKTEPETSVLFEGKQWDGLLLNLNYCPFFGQYGDGELLVFKLGEAHGPDYSSRC